MARRLLLGRAGSGKTHACLDRLTDALKKGLSALLLVPTYSQAEHLRHRLLERIAGFGGGVIQTFSSLAEEVTGRKLRSLAPPALRDMVAARVLDEHFPGSAAQAGFRAAFLAAVKEIKEQGRKKEDLLQQARTHFPEASRGRLLFEAYGDYSDGLGQLDHEDLLIRARDRLREKRRTLDLCLVDGFHDFTPVEREIVDLLAAGSRETAVTLPFDPDQPGNPIFTTSERTAATFKGYARDPLRGNRRARGALSHLERAMFGEPRKTDCGEGVEVIACTSDEDEADRLARFVARARRPYRDILVIRRTFAGLEGLYRAAFRRYGIPLRFFGPESLGHTPAARAATLWLRGLAGGLEPAERLQLMRSPWLLGRPAPEQVDRWAESLRETGEADLPDAAADEGELADLLPRSLGVRDALLDAPEGSEEIARAHRFFVLIGTEAESLRGMEAVDAAARLLRRIPLLGDSSRDRRHDCVYAVEALDARQWEKPLVLVAGLGADSFPRRITQDLFLRDDERQALGDERDLHLPLRNRREDEERYLFYVALTRARERLVLTYPAYDEEGTPRPPSPYLEEALSHLESVQVRKVALAEQYALPEDAVTAADLLPIVADGLSRSARGEGAIAAALHDRNAVARNELAWPRRLEVLRSTPVAMPAGDYAERLSATAVNSYRRCPYLYLVRRVFRVEPAREAALDPRTRGNVVHEALDRAFRFPERDPGELFDEAFEEQTARFRVGLADEAARRWMRAAVLRAAGEMRGREVLATETKRTIRVEDVELVGKIDRIDRLGERELVRDYKTGVASAKAAFNQEDLQLDCYLLLADNPAGAVYERLRKGDQAGFVLEGHEGEVEGREIEVLTPEAFAARAEGTREIILSVARAIRAGRLAVHPVEPEACTRKKCDGYDLCRVVRARWLAKSARERP